MTLNLIFFPVVVDMLTDSGPAVGVTTFVGVLLLFAGSRMLTSHVRDNAAPIGTAMCDE